ncbi:hypothetical protein M9458_055813, partial [Cirrhinus mrigala]
FAEYVEFVLVSCDLPFTVDVIDDSTSPTLHPTPSQTAPDCVKLQLVPTADNEPISTTMSQRQWERPSC